MLNKDKIKWLWNEFLDSTETGNKVGAVLGVALGILLIGGALLFFVWCGNTYGWRVTPPWVS